MYAILLLLRLLQHTSGAEFGLVWPRGLAVDPYDAITVPNLGIFRHVQRGDAEKREAALDRARLGSSNEPKNTAGRGRFRDL